MVKLRVTHQHQTDPNQTHLLQNLTDLVQLQIESVHEIKAG